MTRNLVQPTAYSTTEEPFASPAPLRNFSWSATAAQMRRQRKGRKRGKIRSSTTTSVPVFQAQAEAETVAEAFTPLVLVLPWSLVEQAWTRPPAPWTWNASAARAS